MRQSLLFAIAFGCKPTPTEVARAPASELVTAPGEHAVGHQRISFTYPAIGTGAARTLPVEIWYPADAGGGSTVYSIGGLVQIPDALAHDNAPPKAGPFPVVLYSHGSGGEGALAYPYADLLASHGWVVVAPDHVGNTSLDVLGGIDFISVALDRPADVKATLDALASGDLADAVQGSADVDRTVIFGHSFGGYTVLAAPGVGIDIDALGCGPGNTDPACAVFDTPDVQDQINNPLFDGRIQAILPQAPALVGIFDSTSLADLPVPMLLMSGQRDQTTPDSTNARVAWQTRENPDDHWIKLPQGAHFSFITICDDIPQSILNTVLGNTANDGCGASFTPTSEVVPALASYTLGFAELHGRKDEHFRSLFEADAPLLEAMDLRSR